MELKDLRINYGKKKIREDEIPGSPQEWFMEWLEEAVQTGICDANAMALSTVSSDGRPSSRIVLLKGLDDAGFVFFTNYTSRKGEQLAANPNAALLFFWPELERQIRVEGVVRKTESAISDDYFYSRSPESRVSAVVSPQSKVVNSRESLEQLHNTFLFMHPEEDFERPAYWGGYRLIPSLFEFWQGRSNRLHDRIQFREEAGVWKWQRLAP